MTTITRNPITRDDLLACLTDVHEKWIRPMFFGGRDILIREVTARQRLFANQAAFAENPDDADNPLYQAMLIQVSVVDPTTGTPYADGRTDENGQPLIDPRTRKPLLTLDDVKLIADGRDLPTQALLKDITALSALTPVSLFRGNQTPDSGERDAGAGAEGRTDSPGGSASEGTGDPDGGAVLPDESAGGIIEP